MSDHNENNPRKHPRMTRDQQGPQNRRGGTPTQNANDPENDTSNIVGRHSTGGDRRGLRRVRGSRQPVGTTGRRAREAKRRRASGLPLEKHDMAGPKGKLPGSIVSHYIRIGKALVEAAAAKVVNPDDPNERYVSKGRTGQASDAKRLLKAGTKEKTALASKRVKDHTAGPKGKLPGVADHTLYVGIGKVIAEGLGLVSESNKSVAAVDAAQKKAVADKRAANVEAQKAAADKLRAQKPEKAKPTKVGDVDREKAKADLMASDRKKFPGSRP